MTSVDDSPSPQPSVDFPSDWRYEDTIHEVETLINEIETGQLDLADVFERFTVAVTYLQQCEAFLTDRQGQIELLIEELGDDIEF